MSTYFLTEPGTGSIANDRSAASDQTPLTSISILESAAKNAQGQYQRGTKPPSACTLGNVEEQANLRSERLASSCAGQSIGRGILAGASGLLLT